MKHSGQSERIQGFKDKLSEDLELVEIKENFDDDEYSYEIVKDLLDENKISLIVFLGAGIDGGLKALTESGWETKALTVDQSEMIEKGLMEGKVIPTITQHPYTQGRHAVELIYDHLVRKMPIVDKKILDNSIVLKESMIPHKIKN